jgi:RNA polymerase sigma factor (TIGR02999 family)
VLRESPSDVTALLEAIRAGDEGARLRLVECIYTELHDLAEGLMRAESADHTLQPTALLHEAFARLFRSGALLRAPSRAYLFAAAAKAMRDVLVDHARRRHTEKRGNGRVRHLLDRVLAAYEEQHLDVLALNDALDRLAGMHERQSQVVQLRFFAGLTMPEIADNLGVSLSTVESDFRLARAWLRQQLIA